MLTLIFVQINAQQSPLIKRWDKRFGGSKTDYLTSAIKTRDAGFLLGGTSISTVSGDKTEPNRDTTNQSTDYWIVKTDSNGNKLWDKCFGGSSNDDLMSILQCNDGGYLLTGVSTSRLSGDKTQENWVVDHNEFWVVRIDSNGNKLWDRRYGGSNSDYLRSASLTADGNYILAGDNLPEINGDVTDSSTDNSQSFWIIKIDDQGNKVWDKRYGGSYPENLYSITLCKDNGFLLAGNSFSPASGDKSENNRDTLYHTRDYWVIKIDSVGNKQWDKTSGGNKEDWLYIHINTSDGGYLLGGYSSYGISGDKTDIGHNQLSVYDYWIVKIDSLGNKMWDRALGGDNVESLTGIIQLADGGYLLSGPSRSSASGEKTENNSDPANVWLARIDSAGNMVWDKTILVANSYYLAYTIDLGNKCYLIATSSYDSIKNDKTQNNRDTTNITNDYWIIKYCENEQIQTSLGELMIEDKPILSLSPNPTTNKLTCTLLASPKQAYYQVLSIDGKMLINNTAITQPHFEVDVSPLASGVYYLVLQNDKERIVKQFVKE